jgi:exodeoxyribonuclease VII small subunit
MGRGRKGSKDPGFEEAIGRLEQIVKELEDGDLPLEESLRLFEEGIGLTRACTVRLDEAQRRIDLLTRGEAGDLKLVPFASPDEPGPEGEDSDRS